MFSTILELSETLMLVCFGSSWPFSIVKTLRTKSVAGKSIVFLSLILTGYAFGIVYKLMKHPDAVIWLYAINSSMIFTEIILYFRYQRVGQNISEAENKETRCPSTCLHLDIN